MLTAARTPSSATRGHHLAQLAAVLVAMAVTVPLLSASDAMRGGAGPKILLLLRMACFVGLCTWLLRRDGERWADLGLRRPPRWWMVPPLVLGSFVAIVALTGFIRGVVLPAMGVPPARLASALATPGDLGEYLYAAFLVSWGSAAFGEELVVRGFIMDRIAKLTGSSGTPAMLAAIVLQAALFGAFHLYQGVAGAVITGAVGLVIGLVWLAGGRNLWACILLHGLINFITQTEAFTAAPRT